MGKPSDTLKSLIKAIGPINTFYIGPNGAAYTQLKIINRIRFKEIFVEQLKPSWQGGQPTKQVRTVYELPPKEIVTNEQIIKIPPFEQSYRQEARRAARRDGRIECAFIGAPLTNSWSAGLGVEQIPAVMTIINIAANAKLRSLHRKAIKRALTKIRLYWVERKDSWPDPKQPDTLGWRIWHWDSKQRLLRSPTQGTLWYAAELRVKKWNTGTVVRGAAGIHAARMPYNWRRATLDGTELNGYTTNSHWVVGVVERLGKYVLGTEGWRTEWAIIRALKAPNTEIGLALERAYPELEGKIYYD